MRLRLSELREGTMISVGPPWNIAAHVCMDKSGHPYFQDGDKIHYLDADAPGSDWCSNAEILVR